MFKVKFINVGRQKKSWTSEVECISYESFYKEVKRNGALMSNTIEFCEANGFIYAGFRPVGQFEILGEILENKNEEEKR